MELDGAAKSVNKLLSDLLTFDRLDEHIKTYEGCIETDGSQVRPDAWRVCAFSSLACGISASIPNFGKGDE
jgi:hypothetical protein